MPRPARRRSPARPAVLVIAALGLLVGCTGQKVPTKYTSSVHTSFVAGCVSTTQKDSPQIGTAKQISSFCECAYTAIEKGVPFKEFKSVTDKLTETHQVLPASFQKAYASCAKPSSETSVTTSPSSTTPQSTTTPKTTTTKHA
ncbi:MAG: hypothetical protein JWN46_529 [Acidimicrobiales bacterium]|nr:hypothetical protein [Acidimicrobiales bacterium]